MMKKQRDLWLLIPLLLSVWAVGISARFMISFYLQEDLNQIYSTSTFNIFVDWLPLFALGMATLGITMARFVIFLLRLQVKVERMKR